MSHQSKRLQDLPVQPVAIVPAAGTDAVGGYSLPEVNDEVLVAFTAGETGRTYIIGGLWKSADAPSAIR